ncbi:ImmA/IrrE family metallo-endopeptidase [Roseateles sp.]|uniref:ImmA/IrrE family metallo-endopeptidase n=1 Tax=Roseateles sp. TaxID=1971397 RepID=UPI002DFF5FD8|nr:ImmA/IrrE family metallo-endopeptidase [Roseateles sp.]
MPSVERIDAINPERLAWCLADMRTSVEQVAKETGLPATRLNDLLQKQGAGLSYPQLRKLAEYFGRSVLFFLEHGHLDEADVHSAQFRTLTGLKPEMTRRIRQLIERVERQRRIYLNLLDELAPEDRPRFSPPQLPQDPIAAASIARRWLQLGGINSFDGYRSAVEAQGVLVMRTNGYAGPWQIAKDVPVLGFALYDEQTPLILVKKQDAPARQTFTLMHELGHLLLHKASSIDDDGDLWAARGRERDVNRFAAHLLLPDELLNAIPDTGRPTDQAALHEWLRPWRNSWGLSADVVLLRLVEAGRMPAEQYAAYKQWRDARPRPAAEPAPRVYRYREPKNLFGDHYVRTVLGALNARQISLNKASDYLDGIKVKDIHSLEAFYAGA